MSKLSELLPAGASGKTIEAVATANIASKAAVILNSAGTVTQVAEATSSPSMPLGSQTEVAPQDNEYPQVHADPHNSNRWMQIWMDNVGTKYVRVRVVVRSGATLTMGAISNVNTSTSTDRYNNFAWDNTTSGKFLAVYRNSSGHLLAKVGTVNDAAGNSISYGSEVTISTTPDFGDYPNPLPLQCLGTTGNYFLIYKSSSNNYPYGRVITVSGTTPSAPGSNTVLSSNASANNQCVVNPTDSSKVAAVYHDSSKFWIYNVSISGTTITPGAVSDSSIGGSNGDGGDICAVDATRYVVIWKQTQLKGRIATFSGGSWSFGTTVAISSVEANQFSPRNSNAVNPTMNLQGSANSFICTYVADSSKYYYGVVGTISGTDFTVNTPTSFGSQATVGFQNNVAQQSDADGTFLSNYKLSSNNYKYARLGQTGGTTSNLSATSFVGVADAAISSGAAGTIVVQGGTATGANATLPPVLSFGSAAIFESDGINYPSSTFDSNSNKVVTAYMDDDNSDYGTAVVGTVSGTSVSWGTAVVFEAAATTYISATFDSASNKVVIAYCDVANSNYGTAIVGTVSGTAISFGTPVVFEAAAATFIAATFDSDSNKVVIVYRDAGNSEYGTAIVGTVSGTSISFGTAVVFHTYNSQNMSATFDSTANKVVISYTPANTDYGNAIVGTVSGTAISFGTAVIFESAGTQYISSAFDSNLNKVVISYRDVGDADKGTAVVGTVSGTAISFGTAVVYSTDTANNSTIFDSNSNKIVISYRHNGNSGYGTSIVGTVSGTAISFDTPVLFSPSSSIGPVSATFDSNANKMVVSYQDGGNSDYGTSIVGTVGDGVFTTGSKYYVTSAGSYSTSAGSPSVNAGLAISTTALLLNGDT